MSRDDPQYIIISGKRGPAASPVLHEDLDVVVAEASRLARANPGETFYVFRAIKAVHKVPDVIIEDMPEDIPF